MADIDYSWIGQALAGLQTDVAEIKKHIQDINGQTRQNTTTIAVHEQHWTSCQAMRGREAAQMWMNTVLSGIVGGLVGGGVASVMLIVVLTILMWRLGG